MIIGKSLTALGDGGLKPEIVVTAQAGALLNLHYKDSAIILKTYQLGAEETQHTFVVDVSETAYVVEDVTNSKSVEVLVDAVAVFEANIEDAIRLYLYKDGDECTDVTGGWNTNSNWSTGTVTKNSGSITLSAPNGNGLSVETLNAINSAGYSTLGVEVSATNVRSDGSGGQFEASLSKRGTYDSTNIDARCIMYQDTQKIILKTDINSHTSGFVCGIKAFLAVATFYKVWLE